jgi:hypothetical protein
MRVFDGELWVAGFERTLDLLADSRLRVTRLHLSDLGRRDPDRWFTGWGGLRPVGFHLVVWEAELWLVWLTGDPRFGALAAVYAEPLLTTVACGVRVTDPVLVSSSAFDWSRVGTAQLAAAADGQLHIAHTIGGDGLFDIHALRRSCD